jgi:cell division protein FtsQ
MKKQSASSNQLVKRKKKKRVFIIFGIINRVGTGFLKIVLLFAIVALVSVGFLSLYHYLIASPFMKLKKVEVEGVDGRIRQELIEISDLNSGLSLLDLNLNALKAEMIEHPWVRSVNLERRFPHALIVQAEKETAWALVLMDNKIYYMNPWAEVFKEVETSEKMDFPVITGISNQGSEIQKQLKQAACIMKALESEEGPWALDELSEIHINEDGGMSLYFNCLSAEIKLQCENSKNKIAGLKKVAAHLARTGRIQHVTAIDFNQLDGAVVSFKNS